MSGNDLFTLFNIIQLIGSAVGGFLDDAAVTEDTIRLLFQMWVFQIRPLNLFALFQPKQKDDELGQCHSKMFECLKILIIKALFKFTDLYIYIDIYIDIFCVYMYI